MVKTRGIVKREERASKGWKQEGLISRRRRPLIAPELRERGDSQDKGKKQGDIRGYVVSNAASLLLRPALRSRFVSTTLPGSLYTSSLLPPAALFEFTSRRNLYENLTMLSRAASSRAAFQVLFSRSHCTSVHAHTDHTYTRARARTHIYIRTRKKVENVVNLAEKFANGTFNATLNRTCDRDNELYSFLEF